MMAMSPERTSPRKRRFRQQVWLWLLIAAGVIVVVVASSAKTPTEGAGDDRLFYVAAQLKCVQCVGESVADSAAPIAIQFRTEIREQMRAGRTNDEILDYFASRYDDVLLNPPAAGIGALVWVVPVVVFVAGLLGLALAVRRWTADGEFREMTALDEKLVAEALAAEDG